MFQDLVHLMLKASKEEVGRGGKRHADICMMGW
jgi:hypothetical protein